MKLGEIVETLKITDARRKLFRVFAAVIENDVEENISKTPFQLANETHQSYTDWVEFLETPEINGWVNETIRVIAKVAQRKAIQDLGRGNATSNDVNAYKALTDYTKSAKQTDNSNIVIMHMPDTYED